MMLRRRFLFEITVFGIQNWHICFNSKHVLLNCNYGCEALAIKEWMPRKKKQRHSPVLLQPHLSYKLLSIVNVARHAVCGGYIANKCKINRRRWWCYWGNMHPICLRQMFLKTLFVAADFAFWRQEITSANHPTWHSFTTA